jgi:hypothetical protein
MALVVHAGNDRHRRNSAYRSSPDGVISSLRLAIRACEGTDFTYIPTLNYAVQFHQDTIPLKRGYSKRVRRVSMFEHSYRVGWVVDADFHNCMNCLRPFGWLRARPKHHCRACGALVCHECSPFLAVIPHIEEEQGSRVCRGCFGLKPGIISPLAATPSPAMNPEASMYYVPPTHYDYLPATKLFTSPPTQSTSKPPTTAATHNRDNMHSGMVPTTVQSSRPVQQYVPPSTTASVAGSVYGSANGRVRRRTKLTPRKEAENAMIRKYIEEMEAFEKEQKPKYEEAYCKMRELVPLDIHKSSLKGLIATGITEESATRIWNTKILWLIVTHPVDIAKVSISLIFDL